MFANNPITVIGISNMGGNALNHFVSEYNPSCTMLYVNTDAQALGHSPMRYKMQIGERMGSLVGLVEKTVRNLGGRS